MTSIRLSHLFCSLALAVFFWPVSAQTTDNYQPGPDSKPQAGVPKGEILKFTFDKSKIFPGTTRDYSVYVPAQYQPDKPACVYVQQDGIRFAAPTVFDNLIHKKEVPIIIAVFVAPGIVNAADGNTALGRFNRSYEYDGLGDAYARFLLDELLPDVETRKTSDGRAIRFSHDGNDRAIGGESSGAIAAFTAAWEKPGAFSRVFSAILVSGEGWRLASEGHKFVEGPAVNAKGEVFFNDVTNSKTYKIGLDNEVTEFIADSKRGNGNAFGPDGRLYAVAMGEKKVFAYDADRKPTTIADGWVGNDITVAHNGNVYVTNPPADNENAPSKVWLIKPNGERIVVDTGLKYANGVTLSPDQTLLYVADYRSHWVYSYLIKADGTLDDKQRFYWLHVPDTSDQSNADGIRVDRDGRLYVATNMGIQVCDQAGRVQCIIPTPNGRLSNFKIGRAHV